MAQQRKPVPKTQSQLSNELSGANNALLGDPNKANPNFAGPNRSLQNSFEGDTVKPFTVGIQDQKMVTIRIRMVLLWPHLLCSKEILLKKIEI